MRTHHALEGTTHQAPTFVRPPYGHGFAAVDEVARKLGYRATVHWSAWADDWTLPPPPAATIVDRVSRGYAGLKGVRRGGIVLLHDGCAPDRAGESRRETVDAVRALIPRLRSDGYRLVTVSELLDVGGGGAAARRGRFSTAVIPARSSARWPRCRSCWWSRCRSWVPCWVPLVWTWRSKEIVIVRTSALAGCRFCVQSHAVVALDAGLTRDQVAALRNVAAARHRWLPGPREVSLIDWVDTVAAGGPVDDAARARVLTHWADHEVVELTAVVGATLLLNRFATALALPTSPEVIARLSREGLL